MPAIRLKALADRPQPLGPGHRMCAGCSITSVVRQILLASERPVVVVSATGCLEVTTSIYPFTAWQVPWLHCAFENAAAVAAGVEAACRALARQGRLGQAVNIVVFAGDGGTYDIGLQALSGAWERGHHVLYVCYDNEAYMNTGVQRSSATPRGAWTSTTPLGRAAVGKIERRKDIVAIAVAHGVPYAAQAAPSHWQDLGQKARAAFAADGPAFLNVLAPCVPGWRYESERSIEIARLAVESRYWPLYEVVNGQYRLTYQPRRPAPLSAFFAAQDRFQHLLRPEHAALRQAVEADIERQWEELLRRCGQAPAAPESAAAGGGDEADEQPA